MDKTRQLAMLGLIVDSGITYQILVGSAIAPFLLLARLILSAVQGLALLGMRRPAIKPINLLHLLSYSLPSAPASSPDRTPQKLLNSFPTDCTLAWPRLYCIF
jgi:hypothetical protein